ncbi:UDP-N-acetylmuramate--L-alanine ligase [Paenibacillus larvae]|uniref:UDP-N-acetylmuramate--L-alanine ligase n=1 Tax=Paenibacillus larvae subsp. larvae DSM 25430 TaxID=697284 RepID=V9W9P8_9BACL|nr:UDP-N-acetylmuramate--L-alanine ligase [Paenibacillus larvae]AHD06619.1 UDP-N-acetylmuramate--L-alanine ligase MurC [Paenibacillus larvae subsp. larvae DSM 25430]AVG13177.1 UDP-N-acetylmuramate--L-alanine ligase MurC [Paenibacillus larvae subsp. larvae DSM 25430]MDR5568830.1 UDP-N-acetylmuramate--L-alanine ligase [Paenibacillus larvae]MDR5596895.1 UDP-N-acetylmuramate--L-alanine ligase [Paenibacillus larvae]
MNTLDQHVHFIGIGGYGMSAIAKVMLEMGYQVSGSDLAQQELTEKLIAKGARVYLGHEASHVEGADLVVYSTALPKDNVEIVAAEARNIPILHRSQMLARLMNECKGIAVAGAHGKTTTSSMIALVMEKCGADPTYIIGGEIMNIGSNAKAGTGEYVVAEADESDGTFLQYYPTLALVNNIEADHLENYGGNFENLKKAYAQFLSQVKPGGKAIVCKDDAYIREMIPHVESEVITYGIGSDADYQAVDIHLGDRKVSFSVLYKGENLGKIELSVPGKHNVCNALATLITCLEAGLTFDQVAAAIHEFHGAKRRFQVMGEINDILIIDDYAHHPTEISATISAAKATGKRIIVVFQPQRYTRTFFLFEQFSRCFGEADEVIITDIYSPAGEKQIEGVSSAKLVDMIRQNSHANAEYMPKSEDVLAHLIDHVKPGDLVITMGAGNIWRVADTLAKTLQQKQSQL